MVALFYSAHILPSHGPLRLPRCLLPFKKHKAPPPTTAKNPLPSSLTKTPLPSSLTKNPTISNLIGAMELPRSPARFTVGGPMLNMVFEAAFDGDLPRFKSLLVMLDKGRGHLKETVEVLRVKDPGLLEGLGALHVAACRERLEVCKYLIEELQVDVNGVDKGGRTPLYFTIRKGVGIVKYLLDHGADPNKVNNNGISLLHEATMSGNGEAVKLLLAKGAYVDPVASCGTPLHCAASKGHDDIMKILLDHNADCNKLVNGKTPLNTAGDANSKNCIYLLLKAGADRKAALTYAAEKLQSGKVVSTDFVNCIMGDVAANSILPDDDEPQSKRKIRAAGFQKLASFSFKEEEYLSAAMSYTVALRFDPTNATLYSNRSLCSLRMGKGDEALLDANKCRKLRPDWPKACYRQGAALMLLKDYQGASGHFLDGLKLDPANNEMEDALRKAYDAMKEASEHQG